MNPTLDILFRVTGKEVPSDHGYALYSALSRILETEKVVNGYGERLQYSLFRYHLTRVQMEQARHELEKVMGEEDDLLVIRLSPRCKIVERTERRTWTEPPPRFDIV